MAVPPAYDKSDDEQAGKEPDQGANAVADDIFSLFRTSEENEKVAIREKKRKELLTGPHLVFHVSQHFFWLQSLCMDSMLVF